MILANLKLRDKRLIERITKKGKVYKTPLGLIRYVKYSNSKFTLVISKKSMKLATDRNRTKRRMRALLIKNIDQFPSVAAIIYINANVKNLKWQNLLEKWRFSLEKWPRE